MHRRMPQALLGAVLLWGCGGKPPPDTNSPVDLTPPAVLLTSPREAQRLGAYQMVRLEGTAGDETGVERLTWRLNDGESRVLESTETQEGRAFALELKPRPGANTVVVRAEDAAGHVAEAFVSFHFGSFVSAGGLHGGAVRGGRLYTWGQNAQGQLGHGDIADRITPTLVADLSRVASIAFNSNTSLVVREDGTVWTWGANASGQLGLGTPPVEGQTHTPDTQPRRRPTQVPGLTDAVSGALGFSHALVLKADGTVVAFGRNNNGQLGDGTTTDRDYPVPVRGLTDVVKLAGGSQQSVALGRDGTVWVWGNNNYGNLGQGTEDLVAHPEPAQVPGLSGVVDIASGRDHVLVLHADGTVSAWGLNASGQVGNGESGTGHEVRAPLKVVGLSDVVAVSANSNFSLALKADGTLWGFGQNFNGQLGNGQSGKEHQAHPLADTAVVGLAELRDVAAGSTFGLGLRRDGQLFGWGWNSNGSLGNDELQNNWSFPEPVKVKLP
ncbi:chromosome condensation regulator RCC1 [Archangium sp.]|uniref:RCC1-like domain-containing protein n=1 Tax=Archangium sp. TaxID=1872627 RepID=UPI002D29B237|nr:chromosome condensation regulator RCC1 [Archangium sp.]HYO58720.1 chromosome condensation regulator RCC1 [Archangium sp.]